MVLESGIPCFSLPHSATTDGLDVSFVPWRDETPGAVPGAIALANVPLHARPADLQLLLAGGVAGEADTTWRHRLGRSWQKELA
jgi:hypothetical protein